MDVDIVVANNVDSLAAAKTAEAAGYRGVWMPEMKHDPFPLLAMCAQNTSTVGLGTNIAVAFARNPMTTALLANDLQLYSEGRFMLGLGSQVKAHINRRFCMPWSAPAERMRDYVLAVRSIWASWRTGEQLQYEGEFYRHTLMTSFFDPGPNPYGNPPVLLAGVGPKMSRVAGEVADGFLVHSFTTERYLRSVTVPALLEGRAAAGADNLDGFQISAAIFVVTGETAADRAAADAAVRSRIAFYASTPAYLPVLQTHGWDGVGEELRSMIKADRWGQLGEVIDDEMLEAFAVVADPPDVAAALTKRFGSVLSRVALASPYPTTDGLWRPIVEELREWQPA
ncbi:LLM class F420-dependent oxidoreductase [Mycolicibacterium anyangense]|uniref:LLM class F420-dependent oxidoreductase n=1 Tax=Mycolicibacterium anyangense TaxID=1431246 RepID=A0A6N4WDC9_9MYCO|nr:TIGR03617 family F420-dependent LLM class oxidoreductase [Mycolicibacterium anyangense]BBZ78775.1 LLM class F420-dependent oxidoreductase [Mycolicibacterium anyangense]